MISRTEYRQLVGELFERVDFFKDVFGYGELGNDFAIVGYEKDDIVPCLLTAFMRARASACGFLALPSFNEAVKKIMRNDFILHGDQGKILKKPKICGRVMFPAGSTSPPGYSLSHSARLQCPLLIV